MEETNKEKLHWVGHSQGSLVCMTGLSEKPSYNNKVASLHGLGRFVFMLNIKKRNYSLFSKLFVFDFGTHLIT